MTTDSAWDTRWRNEAYYQGHYYDSMQAPQPPATAPVNPVPQSAIDSYTSPWDKKSRAGLGPYQGRGLPSMPESYMDASNYHSGSHERHTPRRGSSSLTNSPRQSFTFPWQSLPLDPRAQQRQLTDAPLTLHIPKTQGKYKTFSSH